MTYFLLKTGNDYFYIWPSFNFDYDAYKFLDLWKNFPIPPTAPNSYGEWFNLSSRPQIIDKVISNDLNGWLDDH